MRTDKNFRIEVGADGRVKRYGNIATAHIHALKQSRVDTRKKAHGYLDAAGEQNRKMTPPECATFDALTAEIEAIEQAIVLAEREQDLERGSANQTPEQRLSPRAIGRTFAAMFPNIGLDMAGFKDPNEFLATVHSGLADPRLRMSYEAPRLNAVSTIGGDGTSGGFSVPTQIFAGWLDSSLETEVVRPRADVRPMTSDSGVAMGWDDLTHTSNVYGGFVGAWSAEASDLSVQTPAMRLVELKSKKLAILARTSNELAADGVSFEEQLGKAIIRALGWFLDDAFLRGPGAGRPLGVLNSPCTVSVAKETNQAAATVVYENVVKMFSRLAPGSYDTAVWVANQTLIPKLLTTGIAVGTGGNAVPILTKGTDGGWEMLTRPVVFSEKAATIGTKGDLMLVDFSQYIVGLRADFDLQKSSHAGFASDTSYYRGTIRVDGMPKLGAPITPKNGSTLSPFVTLDARP